jgi:single-stranded-DNA-specific exonuclease
MDHVRFDIAPCPLADAEHLQAELEISAVLAQVLVRRGLSDPQAARLFLAGEDSHSPDQFAGMARVTACVLEHIHAGSTITVHGDYDVDGVCSTAILVRALRELDADVDWYLPDRSSDGYGLAPATVKRLAERGTRLMITVDCAITSVEEVALAKSLGMDVIVTDHHAPLSDGSLPDALILHPSVCDYPCADLCATAVAHKLAQALGQAAERELPCIDEDLDLVALATIADVVPLIGENRRLVREGLRALSATAKPGLRALMGVTGVNPARLDERAVGYALAPRLNAAGRLYHADAALELVLTENADRAEEIAKELHQANSERRHTETRIVFEAEAQISELGDQPAYVLAGTDWHAGVIGVVAARLTDRHNRPVVLIALDDESGKGSGRSIESFDLLGALHACSEHLLRYGGHRGAAGIEIDPAQVKRFTEAFTEHARKNLKDEDFEASMQVDAILSARELDLELAEALAALAPFGRANPRISLLLPAARFRDPRGMGEGKHVRFTVVSGGARLGAVAFGAGATLPVAEGVLADGIFALEVHEWGGIAEPRLNLQHAQPCAPDQIELIGERGPYLERVFSELGRDTGEIAASQENPGRRRTRHDRRDGAIAASIVGLVASGEPVLLVCADARLRIAQMAATVGGFSLCSHETLVREPELADPYTHLVLLDPPASQRAKRTALRGSADQHVHLLWGESQVEFARRILERDHDLRSGLVSIYRELRSAGVASGQKLQGILQGAQPEDAELPTGRSTSLACALVRILSELSLIEIDTAAQTIRISSAERTSLEHSATYRGHMRSLSEGRTLLGSLRSRAA